MLFGGQKRAEDAKQAFHRAKVVLEALLRMMDGLPVARVIPAGVAKTAC